MEIKDLAGLNEPITKLVEAIRAAIGAWYEPHQIRRRASAEAEATLVLANAEAQKSEIACRAAERLAFREMRRQANIEQIANSSIAHLPPAVADEPPSDDWVAGFFDRCQDVGDQELQELWARILAGEVAQPGTFSARTLSILKDMSSEDARLFQSFCEKVFRDADGRVFLISDNRIDFLSEYGLSSMETLHLSVIGLTLRGLSLSPGGESEKLWYFESPWLLRRHGTIFVGNSDKLSIDLLSDAGSELIRAVESKPTDGFAERVSEALRQNTSLRLAPREGGGNHDSG